MVLFGVLVFCWVLFLVIWVFGAVLDLLAGVGWVLLNVFWYMMLFSFGFIGYYRFCTGWSGVLCIIGYHWALLWCYLGVALVLFAVFGCSLLGFLCWVLFVFLLLAWW